MMKKTVTGLAFTAGILLAWGAVPPAHAQYAPAPQYQQNELVTNGPQASRGDFGDWSARRNVIESAHYDRLLQTNMGFRQARMRKECGPISDPQLRQPCRKVLVSLQEHWTGLTRFVDDPRIPMDNNASERSLRGAAHFSAR